MSPPPWLALPAPLPGPIGWYFMAFMLLLVPWAAFRTRKRFASRDVPPRMRVMKSTLAQQALFGGLAWLTSRLEWLWVTPVAAPSREALAGAAVVVAVAVLAMRPVWRRAVALRQSRTMLLMPQGPKERAMWVLVSAAAGVSEELVWRGVLWGLLTRVTGNAITAAFVCSSFFALAHALQGWRSMLLIGVFSAIFHLMVWASGTLAAAMVAHAVYDVIAGFTYAKMARETGWDVNAEVAPAEAQPAD
ncbi:MAG: CPBP family intramembrane metalloprotease [Gemmatimonadetes bacterium]|nr:CPBP family intramembrane metalloprotease [Gemmatimonadota bacterium]